MYEKKNASSAKNTWSKPSPSAVSKPTRHSPSGTTWSALRATLVYLIDCAKCGSVQYVGETGNSLQNRFYHHRSDIKTNKNTSVARHFNGSGHTLADLRCTAIEKIKSLSPQTRKRKCSGDINSKQITLTAWMYGTNSLCMCMWIVLRLCVWLDGCGWVDGWVCMSGWVSGGRWIDGFIWMSVGFDCVGIQPNHQIYI